MAIRTNCQGPRLFTTRNITKSDFMIICDQMGCCPEAITEGGFHYINIQGYKSIRMCSNNWPWIDEDKVSAEWRGNQDVILDAEQFITTRLKAFSGAPAFTDKELEDWRVAFESVGIEVDFSCSSIHKSKITRVSKTKFHKQLAERRSMIKAYLHTLSLDQLKTVEELCERLNSGNINEL